MIIHTIISPADIFYKAPEQVNKKPESFSTDPYFYLAGDEYYKKYVQKN